jgi:hypothetical protein
MTKLVMPVTAKIKTALNQIRVIHLTSTNYIYLNFCCQLVHDMLTK